MAKLTAGTQDSDSTLQLLGTKRPTARKTRWQSRYVKLLVIGDSGLGKTTLVRCLLAVPGQPLTLHDGSSTCLKEFNKDPSQFLSTVEWDDEAGHVHWTYQVCCASACSRRIPFQNCAFPSDAMRCRRAALHLTRFA